MGAPKECSDAAMGGDMPVTGQRGGVQEAPHAEARAEEPGVHEEEEIEEEEEFNPYCFIAHLPPYNTVKHHTPEVMVLSAP